MSVKTVEKEKRMSRLFLLLVIGGVLFVAAPCAAGVTPCKFDGLRCRTNEDCCSGVCTANVCAAHHCQAFPATGQTTSFHAGDDGAMQAGAPLSYTDNGDGTITDENTGLMWEKKSADGSIHDMDTSYTWNDAFDVHVAGLNSMNFAGHNDWRLPNERELVSIVNYENKFPVPAVSPAFNTNCTAGCTVQTCSCTPFSYPYWSSTSYTTTPAFAWIVFFSNGAAGFGFNTGFVRAARGGS